MFGFEQCFVLWLPSPDSNLALDSRRSKKQNLISIGQFATSNDAPVRCHSDRVKGFKFKVKANSFWSPAGDQWPLGQCHWLFDVLKIQQTMRHNKHTQKKKNIEMR